MVLQEVVRVLCQLDQPHSLHRRAIALFGLQVAILSPSRPALESRARILASLRILETLENDLSGNAGLEERLKISGYSDVLDSVMREGGAKKLRSLWDIKKFSDDLRVRKEEARDVARMVKFSHRFAEFGRPSPKQKGGSTMARRFVRATAGKSDGTLRTRWREYGGTAVLCYLMLYYHQNLKPKRLARKDFVPSLFAQAENIEALREFFASYLDLTRVLRPRGYRFEDLNVANLAPRSPAYELAPFSDQELRVIEAIRTD